MNLLDGKMHFLGNYHHDFPRLAKQSGFFFQLYRGSVNWSEIESLNLDEITEDRNFELLERNLLNVINCNLERDYDFKILDQNFVKVFKIAQLGIDYLSYCEMYLDRCVVLLQEQIIALQEEVESLKNENDGKNPELKKLKTKKKINNYQCEKCEKVFISDVYLKFHDKRRHSNMTTPKSEDNFFKKLTDAYQQTETEAKLSVSIQTVLEETNSAQENQHLRKTKKIHNKKIKRLEKNLNDLKERLQKAEKALEDTRETNSSSATFNFPPSVYYHPHLQCMPPCCPPPRSITQVIPENSFPIRSPVSLDAHVEPEASGDKSLICASEKCNANDSAKNTEATKIDFTVNKENLDPQISINVTKPLPPPRRSKKKIQNILFTHENLAMNTHNKCSNNSQSVTNIMPFTSQTVIKTPVSLKGQSEPNIHLESFKKIKEAFFEEVDSKTFNSNDSLYSREKPEESRSFFKKVVAGSPKLQKLRKNLQKPLTNFCHSVSSTGKDLLKIENKLQSTKDVLVDGVNNQLRGLGIDPEWKGIPKKTMKQKLKHLTHRRKLLSKENPSYLSVRKSAEEKLFKKLRKNFFTRKTLQKKSPDHREMEEDINPGDEIPDRTTNQPLQNDRNSTVLYDTDTDSKKSDFESSPVNQSHFVCDIEKEQTLSDSDLEEEIPREEKFDISMFQIKKGIVENRKEKCEEDVHEANEQLTNSDFEDYFLTQTDDFFQVDLIDKSTSKNQVKC